MAAGAIVGCAWLVLAAPGSLPGQAIKQAGTRRLQVAKCAFLRNEGSRVEAGAVAYADSVAADTGTTADTAAAISKLASVEAGREAFAAKETVADSKNRACARGLALGDPERVEEIESLRIQQLSAARNRWGETSKELGNPSPDAVLAAINAVYDAEEQSITRTTSGLTGDPDIPKEFPNLGQLIARSRLDDGTKVSLQTNLALLEFAEAGSLYDALNAADSSAGLGVGYKLRVALDARARRAADSATSATLARKAEQDRIDAITRQGYENMAVQFGTYALVTGAILLALWLLTAKARAKVRAIRTGARRMPYLGGLRELVLWEPGETVVLLRNKQLGAMKVSAREGGIASISAWRGEEYKGRVSSKTQLLSWESDKILTADGLPVCFHLGIWWAVSEPGRYVSRIAAEYRDEGHDQRDSLDGAAKTWLEKLAAGTLREQVSRLPSSRIISSRAESFLEVGQPANAEELSFSREVGTTRHLLDQKAQEYGIHVERIEIQDLRLPADFQKTIEEMRRAHIEPGMATLEAQAFTIRANARTDSEIRRVAALADVIGPHAVATKEILRDVDLGALANPLLALMPVMQPAADAVKTALAKGFAAAKPDVNASADSSQLLPPGGEQADR